MKFKAVCEDEIQHYKTDEKHVVISIQDPDMSFVALPEQSSRLGWLGLWFWDFDRKTKHEKYDKHLFTRDHARSIFRVVEEYKNAVDLVLINCVAGVSRSVAVKNALDKIYNFKFILKNEYLGNSFVYDTLINTYNKEYAV